jgi:HD superfamily phosphodiesterase
MSLFTKLLNFVILTSTKYGIDESHGLTHSMEVLRNAHNIYNSELPTMPIIREHERIIYVSAIVHDMCDKKYVNEREGIHKIEEFLQDTIQPFEIDVVKQIIATMSYSTVKKNGFPNLGQYQCAYHIVREADLLSAYDFDRCMVYHMQNINPNIEESFQHADVLFENRVFKHNEDGLFLTEYSRHQSLMLHNNAKLRINTWRNILRII